MIVSLLFLSYSSMAQSLGIKSNSIFSKNEIPHLSHGLGMYFNFKIPTSKFEIILYGDYTAKNKYLDKNKIAIHNYKNTSVGSAGLLVLPIYKSISFKIGPTISYNWITAYTNGVGNSLFKYHKSNYVGVGFMTNLHLEEVFNLPLNIDLIATPDLLLRTKNESIQSDEPTYKHVNFHIGISYFFKRK